MNKKTFEEIVEKRLAEAHEEAQKLYDSLPLELPTDEELEAFLVGVNEYNSSEFDTEATLEEVLERRSSYGVAYTTYELNDMEDCEAHEIQVDVDIDKHCYLDYIDGELVLVEERDNLTDIGEELSGCSFEDVIRDCLYKGQEIYEAPTYLVKFKVTHTGEFHIEAYSEETAIERFNEMKEHLIKGNRYNQFESTDTSVDWNTAEITYVKEDEDEDV